jgi:dienelactone hydrolase
MRAAGWKIAFGVLVLLAAAAVGWGWWQYRQMMTPPPEAPLDPAHAAAALQLLDRLDRGAFEEVHAALDARARTAVSVDQLRELWTALPAQLGGPAVRGPARGIALAGRHMVAVRLEFPLAPLELRVGFDAAGAAHTLRVVPAAPVPNPPLPPDAPFTERELEVGSLGGTLALPKGDGPFPAVVLVHGSGPHDRDATLGPNRPFLDLAHGLASRGIAVLRYDKRTKARPGDFAGRAFTVDDETTADALAAVDVLRKTPGIDPRNVFVAGHSLGALLAPRIASRDPAIRGVVLLAAPARSLVDVVPQQVRYLAARDGTVDAAEQARIDEIDAQAARTRALGDTAPPEPLLLGLPAAYLRDLAGYDPVAVLASLTTPALIVQGGRDYQVTPADDFARWQARFADDPRVELRLLPSLNHLFHAGEGAPGPEEYLRAGTVDPGLVGTLATWISSHATG